MRAGSASRTAEYMALFRALESVRSRHTRLFMDGFAPAFLSPPLRLVVRLARLPGMAGVICRVIDRRWPGARTSAVARTRFIDDRIREALVSGVTRVVAQVVLLGAGYDARAYRLLPREGLTIYEVDHPDTLARKRRVLESVLGALPGGVRFVPIDFNRDTLEAGMASAGFDGSRPTFFLWEGVTNYLTADAVDETLRWCARAAPGSALLFTYVHRAVLDDPGAFTGTSRLIATLAAAGERWTFGIDPARLREYLEERGLRFDEDVGAAEYRRRCYGEAAGTMGGYEFYRIARAHVA